MRRVILAVLMLSIFASEMAFGEYCPPPDKAMKVAPPAVIQGNHSDFRGISLASHPDNVRWRAQSLGFYTNTSYFVGSDNPSAITIVMIDGYEVGRTDFDRTGTMLRLSLRQKFFSGKPKFVRRF